MAESDPSEKHQDLQHKLKEALCRLDTERRLREDAERRIALLQEAHKNDSQLSEAGSSTVEENDKGPVWDFFASIPEYPKDNSEHDLDTTAKNKLVDAPSPPIPGTSTLEPLSSSLEESTNNEQSNDSQTCEWSPPTNGHHRKGSLPRHTRMTEYDREMMQLYREKHAMQMRHEEELHQENIQKAKLEQKKLMLEVQLLEKQLKTPEN